MARKNSYTGKYRMSKAQYLSAKYYALRYNEWINEYRAICDTSGGISYSDMPKGSLNTESPVERAAIRAEEVYDKIRMIEKTAFEASPELSDYIMMAVTNTDITYHQLKILKNIPCGKNMFYNARRRFYWLLYQKI